MKKLLLFLLILFSFSVSYSQEKELSKEEKAKRQRNIDAVNPFARFGYTPKIGTLSKGKYLEIQKIDSVVQIGSYRFNQITGRVTGFVQVDTMYSEATLRPEIVSRWFNPDPLSDEFPSWSPYNFTNDNPIFFIDPTGLAPETIYENSETGETVEVKDNINKTIVVNDTDFQEAKFFANQINPKPDENGMVSIGAVSGEISEAYTNFYDNHNNYDELSVANVTDYLFNRPQINTNEPVGSAGALEYVTVGAGGFILKSLGKGLAKNSSKILKFTSKQLQSKFKHAADFGIKGNWNKAAGSKFSSAINKHINSSSVQTIQGTYRGNPAIHYLNSKSGLNVISNTNGTFISGWKLNSKQLENVIKHGGL